MAGNLLGKPNQIIIPDSVYQGSLIEYQGKHVSPIYIHPTGIVWYTHTHTQTLITVVVIGYIIGLHVHPKIGKVYGLMVAGRQWLQSKRLQIISAFFFLEMKIGFILPTLFLAVGQTIKLFNV